MSLDGLAQLVELLDARTRITELEAEVAHLRSELDRVQTELSTTHKRQVLRAEVVDTTAATACNLDTPGPAADASVPAAVAAVAALVLGPMTLPRIQSVGRLFGALRELVRQRNSSRSSD